MESVNQDLLTAELKTLKGNGAILQLAGEIDISSVHVLNDQFEIAAKAGTTELVLDATEVTFMDSSGIQALVEGRRLIHQNGSTVVLVPSPAVRRLLELVSVEPLFDERMDTVEEALRFLGHGQSSKPCKVGLLRLSRSQAMAADKNPR